MYGLVHPTEWSSILLRVEWQSGQRQRMWESDPQKPHTHTRPLVLHMGDVRCYYYCCTEAPSSWYIIFYQKRFQTEVTGDNNRQSSFCRFEAQCCTVQPHRKGDTTELWKKVPPHISTYSALLIKIFWDVWRKKSGEKRVQEYEFSLLHSFLKAHTLWNGKGRKDVTLSTRGALCDVLWHY